MKEKCLTCSRDALNYGRCNLCFVHWRKESPDEYAWMSSLSRAAKAEVIRRQTLAKVGKPDPLKPWTFEPTEHQVQELIEKYGGQDHLI
jgi:hypothetical protein